MQVDEREPIVRLVQQDIAALVCDAGLDRGLGVVLHVDGWGNGGGPPLLGKVLFNELLCTDLVNKLLTVTEEEGCHAE